MAQSSHEELSKMPQQYRKERRVQVCIVFLSLTTIETIHLTPMTCYSRILCRHCRHQFCWMCLKNWDVHGYNNSTCNAFVEPVPDAASNEAKKNLERWLFYFDRFNNHELSTKLDQELCERTEDRMLEVQRASQLSWIEVGLSPSTAIGMHCFRSDMSLTLFAVIKY